MLLPLLLLLAETPAADTMLARTQALTSVVQHCPPSTRTDVTVCGRRQADRYRVPLVGYDAGDPRHESVAAERERLLHRTTPIDDMGPFLVGGGMAGVSVGTNGVGGLRERPIAP